MRKIKFLLSLILPLIFAASVFSNNDEGNNAILIDKQIEVTNCTLPAPTGLHVTNVTANSITVAWNPVAGAASYEVTSFDVSTGLPLTPPLAVGITSALIVPLPPNTLVEIRVAPVCQNGEVSTNRAVIQQRTDIVIELVVSGYNCTPPSWFTYDFDHYQDTFISITTYYNQSYVWELENKTKQIKASYDLNSPLGTGRAEMGPISTALGELMETGSGGADFIISGGTDVACNLEMFSSNTSTLSLIINNPAPGFKFKIGTCPVPPPGGQGLKSGNDGNLEVRSGLKDQQETAFAVTPNPFNDHLSIQFPNEEDNDGPATAAIYHLNGMLAQSQTLNAASGKTLTFNTSDLPAGMYLLRTETVTGVTTKLVMKTE